MNFLHSLGGFVRFLLDSGTTLDLRWEAKGEQVGRRGRRRRAQVAGAPGWAVGTVMCSGGDGRTMVPPLVRGPLPGFLVCHQERGHHWEWGWELGSASDFLCPELDE